MFKFEIKNRFSGEVQFTAELEKDYGSIGLNAGSAVMWAIKTGANLSGADLRGANLSGANLSGADLRGAYLSSADLRGVPIIENIHQTIYAAAKKNGDLNMNTWHSDCGTTHCRAGFAVLLSGEEGAALEAKIGTGEAAALIYMKSDPELDSVPNWMATNKAALADMKELAEKEAAKV